jgi:hypothetical protein
MPTYAVKRTLDRYTVKRTLDTSEGSLADFIRVSRPEQFLALLRGFDIEQCRTLKSAIETLRTLDGNDVKRLSGHLTEYSKKAEVTDWRIRALAMDGGNDAAAPEDRVKWVRGVISWSLSDTSNLVTASVTDE